MLFALKPPFHIPLTSSISPFHMSPFILLSLSRNRMVEFVWIKNEWDDEEGNKEKPTKMFKENFCVQQKGKEELSQMKCWYERTSPYVRI